MDHETGKADRIIGHRICDSVDYECPGAERHDHSTWSYGWWILRRRQSIAVWRSNRRARAHRAGANGKRFRGRKAWRARQRACLAHRSSACRSCGRRLSQQLRGQLADAICFSDGGKRAWDCRSTQFRGSRRRWAAWFFYKEVEQHGVSGEDRRADGLSGSRTG